MGPIHSKTTKTHTPSVSKTKSKSNSTSKSRKTLHARSASNEKENTSSDELVPPSLSTKKSQTPIRIEAPSEVSYQNKRITMIISTHGNELIKTRLIRPSWDNNIRVFSLSGKLSVCSEYTDEKIREYDRFLKANFAKQEHK